MRVCLAIALFVALWLPSMLSAEQQFGGVVRIHFDESPVPDLSVIHDTYEGSGPTICAHIVIDSLPEGVSGYHLAYEIISEDSSVVVLPGFHPSPGWVVLDSSTDITSAGQGRSVRTPVSVGYWRLWLKKGRASYGLVRLKPIREDSTYGIVLASVSKGKLTATEAWHGSVNTAEMAPTRFSVVPTVDSSSWNALPDLAPVWILEVRGDSCAVIHNGFGLDSRGTGGHKVFPVEFVQVTARHMVTNARLGPMPDHPTAYIGVLPDGRLENPGIQWGPRAEFPGPGERVGSSLTGDLSLFSNESKTAVLRADGSTVFDISNRVKWSMCFDYPRRIAAVATQDVRIDGRLRQLSRILLLDFEGHVMFEGRWTECKFGTIGMGLDPDILKYSLEECKEAGEYLLRIGDSRVYSLEGLPRKGKCFSPDSRFVLVNRSGEFSFFDASDPEALTLLWKCRIEETIQSVAVSDDGEFVAYRLEAERDERPCVYVLSGADGRPIGRLLGNSDPPAPGPMGFAGDCLFVGMDFSLRGTAWETKSIYVFDLGGLVP